MSVVISRSCEPTGEQADICDEYPCFGRGDGSFEVLCQPSAAAEPRECAFDHPTARQDLEAFGAVREAEPILDFVNAHFRDSKILNLKGDPDQDWPLREAFLKAALAKAKNHVGAGSN